MNKLKEIKKDKNIGSTGGNGINSPVFLPRTFQEPSIEKIMINKLETIFIYSDMPNSKKVIRETRDLMKEVITQTRQQERERIVNFLIKVRNQYYRINGAGADAVKNVLGDIINKIKELK